MDLTPGGQVGMKNLGTCLRQRYHHLISEGGPIMVHCSPLQRSIASSLALLEGLSPSSSPMLISSGSSGSLILCGGSLNSRIVPITVEEPPDTLFHGGKSIEGLRQYQEGQLKSVILEFGGDPGLELLLSKLYKTTNISLLSPSVPWFRRVKSLKSIHNLVVTADVEGQYVCAEEGWNLTRDERSYLSSVASKMIRSKYSHSSHGRDWSLRATKEIRSVILHMVLRNDDGAPSFIYFSGHESTITSLTSALCLLPFEVEGRTETPEGNTVNGGVEDAPCYGASLIFEVYLPLDSGVGIARHPLLSLRYYRDPSSIPSPKLPFAFCGDILPSCEVSDDIISMLAL